MSQVTWQQLLSSVITDPAELLRLLALDESLLPAANAAAKIFPLRVTRSFVARMEKGNPNDPLLKQVLPLGVEMLPVAGFTADPVGDVAANKIPGLLHKYQNRVLINPTGVCAINCRYCFRRAFPYSENNPGSAGWKKVMEYIAADIAIDEVIFSGGDPLVANDKLLGDLIHKIAGISHVQRIRFHTRLPIVLPERISDEFIALFTGTRLQPVMMIHCNHPNEIDTTVATALKKLSDANVMLYNQSVLLKGVNDTISVLSELHKKLFTLRIQPYYLNLLDKVEGSAHFEVSETEARVLYKALQSSSSGYLVPHLVREVAGEHYKVRMP